MILSSIAKSFLGQQFQQLMSRRYQISDPVMLYQQQKSHYQHLYHPRTTIPIDAPKRKSHSLYHNNRTTHERDRLRKIDNRKMLLTLLDIYNNKPGLLSRQYDTSGSRSDSKRKSSSKYKKEWQDRSITKENKDLFHQLANVQASVGNQKQWNQHFEVHLQMEKRLRHQTKETFNIKQFRESFTREKQIKLTRLDRKEEEMCPSKERTLKGTSRNRIGRQKQQIEKLKQIEDRPEVKEKVPL